MLHAHLLLVIRQRRLASVVMMAMVVAVGCTRSKYRVAADNEAYHTIAERNGDPRWRTRDYSIDIDSRSRYYDNYSADCPPMPMDDPAAHRYMECVDGMKGWPHWDENGYRDALENPLWQARLSEYVDVNDDGEVKLDVDSALRLAYVNSPTHQNQLETLYLSSLDVTTERFRLDTQFFAGYGTNYIHQGELIPPALRFEPTVGRYVINPAIDGVESNRLTVGRPFAGNPAFSFSRRFATAGTLLVGFANSFVFEFTGDDANLTSSLVNFSFVQPLLRGGGRDIALEELTFFERVLLANLRSYAQFRQGFYTQVAVGELGVSGPQRGGRGTALQVFSGRAPLGGYVGLLRQLQQIRNSEDNLNLQLRTLAQLEALLDAGLINLVQVDQFRQNVENDRASLLRSRNDYLAELDGFKTRTLGLPPNLPVSLDDTLIKQFQLVDREATEVQDSVAALQDRVGALPANATSDQLAAIVPDLVASSSALERQLGDVRSDLDTLNESLPERQEALPDKEAERLGEDVEQLELSMADIERQFSLVQASVASMQASFDSADAADSVELRDMVILLRDMLRIIQGAILVQARSRLETVSVETIDLNSEDALRIALTNRLDFMNGRASLVDTWRLIQVNADALQSFLNLTADGNVRTAKNNPVSFRAPTANVQMGIEFDAPLTRLVERNQYRESLINYQRSRRQFIQSRDSLHLGLRVLLREIEQLRENLEIQRRAVAIAIRRVDLTRAALYAPVVPPQPGQRAAQFGPTAAFDLLSAQSALRDTQNSFLSVWLNYYAARMRLARELGVMMLDTEGRWVEMPPSSYELAINLGSDCMIESDQDVPLLPGGLLEQVEELPEGFTFEVPVEPDSSSDESVLADDGESESATLLPTPQESQSETDALTDPETLLEPQVRQLDAVPQLDAGQRLDQASELERAPRNDTGLQNDTVPVPPMPEPPLPLPELPPSKDESMIINEPLIE